MHTRLRRQVTVQLPRERPLDACRAAAAGSSTTALSPSSSTATCLPSREASRALCPPRHDGLAGLVLASHSCERWRGKPERSSRCRVGRELHLQSSSAL
eukprot:14298252-Alexandrium_andersonii.AAC.1